MDPASTFAGTWVTEPWLGIVVLAAAGLVAGVINTVAGGGSFLTLPLLIFYGLPAGVANGTNRIGVLLQCAAAAWSFDREQVLERGSWQWAAVPSMLGAVGGTLLALWIDDSSFTRILAFLMVAITLLSFWSPREEKNAGETAPEASARGSVQAARGGWLLAASFFLVGVYGGFVQAGVGFLILAATTFAGLDLVRGNAVKVLSVLCFTALSLAMFAAQGRVSWGLGLALGVGQLAGGVLGARLTVKKGHRWLRGVVTAAVLFFAVLLWLS